MDRYSASEVVVITGATAGVGRATARAFAGRGAHVALLARDADRLEATRRELEALGGKGIGIPVDVSDAAAIERAAETIEENLGEIDIWVNAAMVTVLAPLDEIAPQEFARVTEVTYLGNVYATMAALKRMLPRDRGTIVQVGSALAHHSIPLQAPYCGAKHAVKGYTEALRIELLHRGSRVHVTLVDMPALNTPQFDWALNRMPKRARPVAPVYQPEVAARAIVWAAHHRRARVDVGLSSLLTRWADKLAPGLLDRYLARGAVGAQQTDERSNPAGSGNLWQSVAGERGAHGRFGGEAYAHSIQLWATSHRGWLAFAGAVLALGAVCASAGRRHESKRRCLSRSA